MESFGKIFKTIRKARNISLEEATGGEFSVSMLSRFENGKTEISAQKLRVCLNNVYLSMTDFETMISDFQPTEIEKLVKLLHKYNNPFDKDALIRALKEQEELAERVLKRNFTDLTVFGLKV